MSISASHEKLPAVSFVRAICIPGIAIFHFCCYANSSLHRLMMFANGYVGEILVTVFFVISGAVLFYNHPVVSNTAAFYRKRWLSIFPAFYLAFVFFFLVNVFSSGTLLYDPELAPWKLVYSLLGIDGYMLEINHSAFSPNWYQIGEWFQGALLFLYLLYPLLCRVCSSRTGSWVVFPVAFLLLIIQAYYPVFLVNGFRNFYGCLCSFTFGIMLIRHRNLLLKPITLLISLAVFFIMLLIQLPIPSTLSTHLCGFSLFILLYALGNSIMNYRPAVAVCNYIGKIGLPVFLVQHKLVKYVQSVVNPVRFFSSVLALLAALFLILCSAQILKAASDAMIAHWPFRKKEHTFS